MTACDRSVYLAPGAQVIEDVEVGQGSSLWSNAVVRGDMGAIRIGCRTNIQDNAVVHGREGFVTSIGDDCVVGHGAIVHGCTVGDGVLVGMGSIVLDGAVIGPGSIVGAGALVTQGKVFPENSLIIGSPARVVRETTPEERAATLENAALHVRLAAEFRDGRRQDA